MTRNLQLALLSSLCATAVQGQMPASVEQRGRQSAGFELVEQRMAPEQVGDGGIGLGPPVGAGQAGNV